MQIALIAIGLVAVLFGVGLLLYYLPEPGDSFKFRGIEISPGQASLSVIVIGLLVAILGGRI